MSDPKKQDEAQKQDDRGVGDHGTRDIGENDSGKRGIGDHGTRDLGDTTADGVGDHGIRKTAEDT